MEARHPVARARVCPPCAATAAADAAEGQGFLRAKAAAVDAAYARGLESAAAREAELGARLQALGAEIATLKAHAGDERRRNASVLQELATTLSASHGRTLEVLEAREREHRPED